MWGETRGGERLANQRRNIGAVELDRREVDCDRGIAGPAPAFQTGLVQDLIADFDDESHLFGNGNELRRGNHSAFLVGPSQQRLASLNASGLQIEERLIVEFEFFGVQGVAQIKFKISARLGVGFHFCLEPAPRTPAVGFRLIQSHVGVAQKLVRIDAVFGDRNADTGGDDDFVSVQIVGACKRVQSARGESLRLIEGFDRCLKNDKLVATEARNDVGIADGGLQPLGDGFQQHIAPCVPQGVVDLLELVEIDEVNGTHVVGPPCAQGALHVIAQDVAVGQTGQRIESRQMIDLGFGNLALGDILDEGNHAAVFHGLHGELECAPV